jgi:hypothetical protein
MERPEVWVEVSRELLDQLGEWSQPIQVRVTQRPDGKWTMEARTHTCRDEHDDR